MIKTSIKLQDLRRRIDVQAKAEKSWRFWRLSVPVCKGETLRAADERAKQNNDAPGIDGVTFEAIEEAGGERFLQGLRDERVSETDWPLRNRRKEIPQGDGRVRILGRPSVRDRGVQGALKRILEPLFEADFQEGS
jgi:RNA-directed DNA polymerase